MRPCATTSASSERARDTELDALGQMASDWITQALSPYERLWLSLLREAGAEGLNQDAHSFRDVYLEGLRGYPPFEEFIRPKEQDVSH